VNKIIDIHRSDPEFGYRLITEGVHKVGVDVCDRQVQRLCHEHQILFVLSPRAKKRPKPKPASADDLVERDFTAERPNVLWLTDITEHPTGEGKLYLCAIKDVWSKAASGGSLVAQSIPGLQPN